MSYWHTREHAVRELQEVTGEDWPIFSELVDRFELGFIGVKKPDGTKYRWRPDREAG